jgi:hypothetical protein
MALFFPETSTLRIRQPVSLLLVVPSVLLPCQSSNNGSKCFHIDIAYLNIGESVLFSTAHQVFNDLLNTPSKPLERWRGKNRILSSLGGRCMVLLVRCHSLSDCHLEDRKAQLKMLETLPAASLTQAIFWIMASSLSRTPIFTLSACRPARERTRFPFPPRTNGG